MSADKDNGQTPAQAEPEDDPYADYPQSILRAPTRERFVVSHVKPAKFAGWSWKARGILWYVLTLPDNWVIYISELAKHATDGISSTRAGIRELQKHGYCQKVTIRRPNGTIVTVEWHISEMGEFDAPARQVVLGEGDPEPARPSGKPLDRVIPPVNQVEWLEALRAKQHRNEKIAVLRWMIQTLYPDREPPDFAFIGKVARDMRDAGKLARLIWEFADTKKCPDGELLPYLVKVWQARKAQYTRARTADPAPDSGGRLTAAEKDRRRAQLAAARGKGQ